MLRPLFAAFGIACLATAASAQDTDSGRQEYMIACAGCHGESGLGDGPIADLLEIETPNLTQLTKRAGGSFPYRNTLLLIDGRNEIRAHGSEMPVWGNRYFSGAAMEMSDTLGLDPERAEFVARGRLLALVEYLSTIQEE